MKIARIASAALAVSFAVPAAAQPAATVDEAYVAAFYADLAADPDALRARMEEFTGPLRDDIWAATAKHLTSLVADPAYAPYVFDRLPESLGAADADDLLAAFVAWGNTSAYGILRLSPEDQEANVRIAEDLYGWLRDNDPAACAVLQVAAENIVGDGHAITLGLVDAARSIAGPEFQFYAAQGPDYAERSLAMFAAAVTAEIHDSPKPRGLGSGPVAAVAMTAYESALVARIQSAPNAQAISEAFMAIAAGADIADPAALCDGVVLTVAALWDLPPAQRSTAVLGVLTATVDPAAVERALGYR